MLGHVNTPNASWNIPTFQVCPRKLVPIMVEQHKIKKMMVHRMCYFKNQNRIIHVTRFFVTSYTYRRSLSKVIFVWFQTPSKTNIFRKLNTLGKNSVSVELPSVLKILKVLIFGGDWHHTKYLFNFLEIGYFSHIELYCFCNLGAIGK